MPVLGGFLLVLMLVLTGCATFNSKALESVNNAAVVSVFCDKRIDMSDFKGMAAFINQIAQDESFRLEPVAESLKNDIFEDYAPHFPFSLMDEETVIGSTGYQTLYDSVVSDLQPYFYAIPKGYQVVYFNNGDAIDQLFNALPDADGLIFVWADFVLDKVVQVLGFGTAKVRANHSIYVVNRAHKIVLAKYNYASSDNTIKFALGGVFDASQIQPLCEEATAKAAEMTTNWIRNELAK